MDYIILPLVFSDKYRFKSQQIVYCPPTLEGIHKVDIHLKTNTYKKNKKTLDSDLTSYLIFVLLMNLQWENTQLNNWPNLLE
jgi:hypothetical protein